MTIADTDILIDYLSGAEPGAGRVLQAIEHGELHTTAVTGFELLAGARTARGADRNPQSSRLDPDAALGRGLRGPGRVGASFS